MYTFNYMSVMSPISQTQRLKFNVCFTYTINHISCAYAATLKNSPYKLYGQTGLRWKAAFMHTDSYAAAWYCESLMGNSQQAHIHALKIFYICMDKNDLLIYMSWFVLNTPARLPLCQLIAIVHHCEWHMIYFWLSRQKVIKFHVAALMLLCWSWVIRSLPHTGNQVIFLVFNLATLAAGFKKKKTIWNCFQTHTDLIYCFALYVPLIVPLCEV